MSTPTHRRRSSLAAGALAVGVAFACLIPTAASAAPVVSQANGRLLDIDGAIDGVTDVVVELQGAGAVNAKADGDVITNKPLDAEALTAIKLTSTGANLLGDNGIIKLGAVGQYARANNDGSSTAFAGGVSSANGLIGVDSVTPSDVGNPDGNASVALSTSQIIGGTDLVKLGVNVGALAASAEQATDGTQTGKYVLSDVEVLVGGTVLESTVKTLHGALATVITAAKVTGLDLPNPLRADGTVLLTEQDLLDAADVASLNDLPANTDLLLLVPEAVVTKLTTDVNVVLDAVDAQVTKLGLAGAVLKLALDVARGIVNPVLSGLGTTVEGPLSAAIDPLAALVVNGKITGSDGSFTETALSLQLGSSAVAEKSAANRSKVMAQAEPLAEVPNGRLAVVDLARATVGPNAGEAAVPIAGPESLLVGGGVIALAAAGYVVVRRRRTADNPAAAVAKGV